MLSRSGGCTVPESDEEEEMARRGKRGSGNGSAAPARYVARYDYPDLDIKAGQEFCGIEEVPTNIVVAPILTEQ